jgi:K+-sensing histidine kinase KdpD
MTDTVATNRPDAEGRAALRLYLACGLLTIMIFLLDTAFPLGVAMAVPYIAVVLFSLRSPRNQFTLLVAVICSALTIAAFFLKPPTDELWKAALNRALALFAIGVTASLGLQRKIIQQKREMALLERQKAMDDLKILRGLLPICASCKRIRDDQGSWTQIEGYIQAHSEADFSHGICPDCSKRIYPDFQKQKTGGPADT